MSINRTAGQKEHVIARRAKPAVAISRILQTLCWSILKIDGIATGLSPLAMTR